MNKQIALENLYIARNTLPNMFLCYGTALGAIREGNFIDHDLDTDIGIMEEDFTYTAINELVQQGFNIVGIFGNPKFGFEVSFRRLGVKMDLMVFYRLRVNKQDLIWNSLWDNACKYGLNDMIVHSYPELKLKEVSISGQKFACCNEDYLKHVYGDWKVPVEKWDWRTDHLCRDDMLFNHLLTIYG